MGEMTERTITLAAELMARDETEDGSIDPVWFAHWQAKLPEMLMAEHSGDCTKQPWTCSRCLSEEYTGLALSKDGGADG